MSMINIDKIPHGQELGDFSDGIEGLRERIAGFRLLQHNRVMTNYASGIVRDLVFEASGGRSVGVFNRCLYLLGLDVYGNYNAVYFYEYTGFGIVTFKIDREALSDL
jgi:hypothetical protein